MADDSCIIIQVADRHGNETAQQALIGRPLWKAEKLRKNFKKSSWQANLNAIR